MLLCLTNDIDFNMSVDHMCWLVFIVYDLIKIFYTTIIIFGFFLVIYGRKEQFFCYQLADN